MFSHQVLLYESSDGLQQSLPMYLDSHVNQRTSGETMCGGGPQVVPTDRKPGIQ